MRFASEKEASAMTKIARMVSFVVLSAFLALALLPAAAFASVKGRKHTAIGLGALSLYELSRGHTGTGLVVGAGAAYAYKRYKDQRTHRHHHPRYYKVGHGHYEEP
jgi:hypothetical protein